MSSKTNDFETEVLELLFNDTDISGIGSDIRADGTAGNLYVALYTSTPTEGGAGTECDYTGYFQRPVGRSGSGWTVSGNQVSNTAQITFGVCTNGNNTVNGVAILSDDEDSEHILYYGALDTPLSVTSGVQPIFPIGALVITED